MARTGRKPRDPVERFWGHVQENPQTGCWEFTISITRSGYAQFKLPGKRRVYAHRYAWEITNGPIPEGLVVCHRCDNRICVRPDHLFLGTQSDNEQDKWRKGRNSHKGERNPTSKLTVAQVREIRERYANGINGMMLAQEFGITFQHAYAVISRKVWAHIE